MLNYISCKVTTEFRSNENKPSGFLPIVPDAHQFVPEK